MANASIAKKNLSGFVFIGLAVAVITASFVTRLARKNPKEAEQSGREKK